MIDSEDFESLTINALPHYVQFENGSCASGHLSALEFCGLALQIDFVWIAHPLLSIIQENNQYYLQFEKVRIPLHTCKKEYDQNLDLPIQYHCHLELKQLNNFLNVILEYYLNLGPEPWEEDNFYLPYSLYRSCENPNEYQETECYYYRGISIVPSFLTSEKDGRMFMEIYNEQRFENAQLMYCSLKNREIKQQVKDFIVNALK